MTIKEGLKKANEILKEKDIEEPILKSRILLAFILCQNKEYLITHEEKELTPNQTKHFKKTLKKLTKNEPIQHITGIQQFMGLEFLVNKNVLIPRPDTEILVEEVIHIANDIEKHKSLQILDLCTGSGAIGISIAKQMENVQIVISDKSGKAMKVAKRNVIQNNVTEKIEMIKSDLFFKLKNRRFDIIVSNPPYIRKEVIKTLDKVVQKEPILALDGRKDGLYFYKKIIEEAERFLNPKGYLCLEIGYDQKEEVMKLMQESKKYDNIYTKQDLAGNDRIVICNLK